MDYRIQQPPPYLDTASTTHAPAEYPELQETVDRPLGVQEGDVVLVCSVDGEAAEGFGLIYSQPTTEHAAHHYYMRTWWKRATANEPGSYTFPGARGLWAVRISGTADLPAAVAGHAEPEEPFESLFGIWTPSVDAPEPNCLIIRISSNFMYPITTEPHQWIQWPLEQFPCFAASWKIQEQAGPTGEEYHGTDSFIYFVAQTIAIAPATPPLPPHWMSALMAFGMGLILMAVVFGLVKEALIDAMEPKRLLPQTGMPEPTRVLPQVLIEGGEPMPPQYRHLIWWVKDPLPEYSLMTLPAVVPERRYSVEEIAKKLEEGVKTIHEDRNFRLFLETMSKFHDYSFGNQLLIMLQKPDATKVAGFVTWKELGRYVKKGERGIAIQAPGFPAKDALWERRDGMQWTVRPVNREWGIYLTRTPEGHQPVTLLERLANKWEAERRVRDWGGRRIEMKDPLEDPSWFKIVYVFDITQTEGKPLPEFEVPVLTVEVNEELFTETMMLSRKQGLEVSFESRPHQDPAIKGQYRPPNQIWIRPEEPRAQQLKSLLHEVAHYYSEGVFRIPRADAETIAESVSYVVGAHYGFDTGTRSFPYVALWAKDEKVLRQNLDAIRRVSTTMLDKLAEIEAYQAMVPQTIPIEDLERISRQYGIWAARLAQAVCPHGDVACVEREARRLFEARRARLR